MVPSRNALLAVALGALMSSQVLADGGVLSTPKAVVGLDYDQLVINIDFKTPVEGDLYLFTENNGERIYLLADGQLSADPVPVSAGATLSGSYEVYSLTTFPGLAPASYPVYSIVTVPGGDPTDIDDWVSGVTTMNKVGIQLGLPPEISGDFDGDGFADSDKNHDGFFDDDRNQDGYHDNDLDRDGFRETDKDHDGYDDEDRDRDGFRDDDEDRDGFSDLDRDFDGFRDDRPVPVIGSGSGQGEDGGEDGSGEGHADDGRPGDIAAGGGDPLDEFGGAGAGGADGEHDDHDSGSGVASGGGSGEAPESPASGVPGASGLPGDGGFGGFGG